MKNRDLLLVELQEWALPEVALPDRWEEAKASPHACPFAPGFGYSGFEEGWGGNFMPAISSEVTACVAGFGSVKRFTA